MGQLMGSFPDVNAKHLCIRGEMVVDFAKLCPVLTKKKIFNSKSELA